MNIRKAWTTGLDGDGVTICINDPSGVDHQSPDLRRRFVSFIYAIITNFVSFKLPAYMIRHLCDIMNISWYDKITYIKILEGAGLQPMEDRLIDKNLMWLGHVERMNHG